MITPTATPCHHGVAGTRYCWACAHPEKTGENAMQSDVRATPAECGCSVSADGQIDYCGTHGDLVRAMARPPSHGNHGWVRLTGAVESIDGSSYPEDRAKLGIRDAGGGYSIVAVPRDFARALSLGSAVSITVLTLKETP